MLDRVQLIEYRRNIHSDRGRTDSPFGTDHSEHVSSTMSRALRCNTRERRVQLFPRDRIRHALVCTRAHRIEDERTLQARQHDEDTGRLVLTLDDGELGWHRAPIRASTTMTSGCRTVGSASAFRSAISMDVT